jgi:hypothetical protein
VDAASKLHFYRLTLNELRIIGDDLMRGIHYILDIERYVRLTDEIRRAELKVSKRPGVISLNERSDYEEQLLSRPPPSLPEKPPSPKTLTS